MTELTTAPTVNVVDATAAAWLTDNAVTDASIASYLAAGARMRDLADAGLKICAVLVVLLIAAWAFGVLPGAVRPF